MQHAPQWHKTLNLTDFPYSPALPNNPKKRMRPPPGKAKAAACRRSGARARWRPPHAWRGRCCCRCRGAAADLPAAGGAAGPAQEHPPEVAPKYPKLPRGGSSGLGSAARKTLKSAATCRAAAPRQEGRKARHFYYRSGSHI